VRAVFAKDTVFNDGKMLSVTASHVLSISANICLLFVAIPFSMFLPDFIFEYVGIIIISLKVKIKLILPRIKHLAMEICVGGMKF
jgi:hypothetical protein